MSQEAVERLLGRLITDEGFRSAAAGSLEAVCRQEGYALSPAEVQLVNRMDLQGVALVGGRLDPALRRVGGRS